VGDVRLDVPPPNLRHIDGRASDCRRRASWVAAVTYFSMVWAVGGPEVPLEPLDRRRQIADLRLPLVSHARSYTLVERRRSDTDRLTW
jgi:hypothetical protein